MKKAMLSFIATAMSLLATTAQAYNGEGDIRSIDPCDQYGYVIGNGSMAQPYTAGQTAYFRIRLENVNSRESWETKDTSKLSNPWTFEYTGFSPDPQLQWAINPPKVGVYVSGQLRGATVVSALPTEGKGWYTDLLCSYTVRPGDLALPMTLANSAGKEVGDSTASEYYLETIPRSSAWRLVSYERESAANWNTVVATNTCTFKYGNTQFFSSNASAAAEMVDWTEDYSLKQAGLYIKSVDFAASEYSVAEGRTEKVQVDIIGGVNTNGNGTVYAMVKDGEAVGLAEDVVETVTISHNPAREMDGVYQVAKVTIPSGEEVNSFTFKVKGNTKGGESTVYLSTTKEFTYGDSADLVTNFVTAVVKCVEPPPPYISVTIDGAASKSVTSSANYTDYAAKLTVTLSEPHTSDVTVDVTPSMISGSGTDPLAKYIGMSTYSENGFLEKVTTVTFTATEMANGTLSKNLYVYVRGADDDTDGIGKGIQFKPENVAIYNNENVSAILYIKKSTPQILYPTEGYSYPGLAGGVASTFSIKISDDYSNMQSPFTVEWLKTGSGTPQIFTDVRPNADGEAIVSVRYNAGEYVTRFRVKNAAGVYSEYRTVTVQVNPAKQVSAVVTDPAETEEFAETLGEISVKFTLTESHEDNTLYAFLVPLDEASSNLVVSKAFTQGISIKSGDTESTGVARLELLDGTDLSQPLTYSIVLRTARTWNTGETIGTYESKDLELFVNNVKPSVLAVNMTGSAPVFNSGDTFGGKASMGLNKIFSLEADDVEADLTNAVTSVWTFSDPNGYAVTKTVTAPLDEIEITNVFEVAGTYSCTVKLQDKDMGKREYGDVFNFNVVVLDTPTVKIEFPNSETYNETDCDKGLSYFYVSLSTPASKAVEVEVECVQQGSDGVFKLSNNRVTIRANQTRSDEKILIDELDGTAESKSIRGGYTVTAKVVTETTNEDGIAFKDVYLPATEKMYVANEPPTIELPRDYGATNRIPVNVNYMVPWKISDVLADMTNGLVVKWITSEQKEYTSSNPEGVFTNMFKNSGYQWIELTVTDKDGGSSVELSNGQPMRLHFWIEPSKRVLVYPYGPLENTGNDLVDRIADYMGAAAKGRGKGRVWASPVPFVADFKHEYSYAGTDKTADLYAWGYKVGQVDDGNLDKSGKGRDIAINMTGDLPGVDDVNFYTYGEDRDSFFYGWAVGVRDDKGAYAVFKKMINPATPGTMNHEGQYSVTLPMEQQGDSNKTNPDYPDCDVAALFSKEYYTQDNMGDMNGDKIPDYYAVMRWSMDTGESKSIAEAMTGRAISTGGEDEGEEGESVVPSDLTEVDVYNGDLDFFPAAYRSDNPLNPTINKSWGPGLGREFEFTAEYEIRGIGQGLNQPGVSEYDLTPAEKYALYADYAAANGTLTGSEEENYIAATNWAATTGWTPEAINPQTGARLNPLKADTDGDGLEDGWEYFFWYHAKIGAIDQKGNWSRLEGRRYNPLNPAIPDRIAPDEIVAQFDPHSSARTVDFDNDGLADIEEYILGTNPISCGSDDDGVSDLWKVMNGIDPTSPFNNDGNPDCDFMARCDYNGDTFTLYTFENGEIYALPTKTASSPAIEALGETAAVYKVEFASGDIAWFETTPITIPGVNAKNSLLARDTAGYASFEYEGTEYLGTAKIFGVGSAIKSIATNTVDMTKGSITGLNWTNPDTLHADITTEALPLFKYPDEGSFINVPCVTNVSTYVSIPTNSALVSVETEKIVTLLHYQVLCQYGFDPRVAWNVDNYGYVDQRWRKADSIEADGLNATGLATNTVPYKTKDEYYVMLYRQKMGIIDVLESVPTVEYLRDATTFPNLPVAFVREAYYAKTENAPFAGSTNRSISVYWEYLDVENKIHGADTDSDGIPDGWELYVNADPNLTADAKLRDGWAKDDDELNILQEYAGVDSCNAYTNRYSETDPTDLIYPEVTSITKNHPGKDTGWWNKFFPSNPYDKDTDGDGIMDDAEGKGQNVNFWVGNNWYGGVPTSFIYGDETFAEKYAADGSSVCFRGGGLNPCTVDTDGDLLPDAWEFQYAGILFENGETTVPLSDADLKAITAADGKQKVVAAEGFEIRGGMDGTFKGDANYDIDHDGLANCQEYLVQSLRHFRYDDSFTPLMGIDPTSRKFIRFMPFSAWDGEAFHKRCLEAGFTGLASWRFRDLGYFALPPHEWDMLRQNDAGLKACKTYEDFEGAGYRVMLPPTLFLGDESFELYVNGGKQYACTDPRCIDTDRDGMDDYWELFHGLNPLLGSYADLNTLGEYGWNNLNFDVIASIYRVAVGMTGELFGSWNNHWAGLGNNKCPPLDPIKYPWLMGVMEADADGDGLRNDEEALKVNLAKPRNTHTDPTPLWMTDSSGKASYTAQYYNPDPYIAGYEGNVLLSTYPDLLRYPWGDITANVALAADGMGGATPNWMFAFEENEGYDTDHDFRRDATELTRGVEMASDPMNHTDLDRRQALYFPGWNATYKAGSAAVSYGGEFRRSPSTEPDLLKQFTVECWVKPDGAQTDVTILERVCDYGASTMILGDNVIRANFRIGIDANGCAYGEFQGSTADSATARVTANYKLPVGEWTHIAFRYDGVDAHLHLNGESAPVASVTDVGFLPANGVDGIVQTPNQSVIPLIGYRALPCATVLGASMIDSAAFNLDEKTTWNDYGKFYKGWIDEVRIWDGARTSAEIHSSYKKRFSMDDIKLMRSNDDETGIFNLWITGIRRSGEGALALPAELLQHYSFSTLPGGVEMGNVITEPTGFREGVLNNVRKPNGESLDLHTMVGWWYNTPVHSLVYWDYHVVPWIPNTVAHLPFLDGSAPDSQFWSSGIAGVSPATTMGVSSYEFPNAANPYPYYFYRRDRYNRLELLGAVENQGSNTVSSTSMYGKWAFELRSGFVGTSDLVPLGLAYAKRDSSFWDGQGAMDAWADTKGSSLDSADTDKDGIPDWAERLGIASAEEYLRALAAGLLPTSTSKDAFADAYKSTVDGNFDGVKDWWQKIFGLAGSAQTDSDNDGLADFAEYLASEIFGFGDISPLLPKSDGVELDYFRKVGKLYLGEMLSDHDFMEDHLEREYASTGAKPAYYDAHIDADENGWSNWADLRAKWDMGYELSGDYEVKTNVIYQTYVCYDDYYRELTYVLGDTKSYELLESDFTIVGLGHWFTIDSDAIWHDDFYGSGFIKYYVFTPVYAKTHRYKGTPVPEVEMTVRYNGLQDLAGRMITIESYSDETLRQCDAQYSVVYAAKRDHEYLNRNVNTLVMKDPVKGHLREGMNTFVVTVSNATSNASAANIPSLMGVARNVDVGWKKVKFDVELIETSSTMPRAMLPSGGTNGTTKVYVYRYAIDDMVKPPSSLDYGPVMIKDIGLRNYLHEGDALSDKDFDLDWSEFQDKVLGNLTVRAANLPVNKVTYRVYTQPVNLDNEVADANTNKLPFVEIVREFGARAKAVSVAPGEDSTIYYGGQPTFRWKIEGDRADTYTAFAIKVTDTAGNTVWTSGTQMLPPRNINGEYEWTAPLYVGDLTSHGVVFGEQANYKWFVTVYNSKFQNDSWSAERLFRVNVYADDEPNNAGYYRLNANVKYYGPAESGIVRVEAFTSPDFSGMPAGRTFITNLVGVAEAQSVTIAGLAAGTYYVRAYIDSDNDTKRANWESWGYACSRGEKDVGAIYAPTSFTIGDGIETPVATFYIEDCDVDQDALPDAWEYAEANGAEDFLQKQGPMENKVDGYITVNPELVKDITRAVKANGGSSLMSLAASGYMPSAIASMMLGVNSVEPEFEEGTVGITAFALDGDTVKLTVGAKAEDPLVGTVFVSNGKITAKVVVLHAASLATGFAPVKTVNVTFDIEDGAVSHTESISLKELLGSDYDTTKGGFFKVELK